MKRSAHYLLGAAAILASGVARAETEAVKLDSAEGEARLNPASIGVPTTGIVLEGGSEQRRITARVAIRRDQIGLALSFTGADADRSTGRSLLYDTLDVSPGGSASAAFTWSNFDVKDHVVDQVEALCEEQDAENERLAQEAVATAAKSDTAYKKALETEALRIKDQADAQNRLDAALKAQATAAQAAAAQRGPDDGGVLRETRASVAELVAMEAERALKAAKGAAEQATEAVKKERAQIRRRTSKKCYAESNLSPDRRARISRPFSPTFVLTVRGTIETKSTDYFDPEDGKDRSDIVHPWDASAGAGVFLDPRVMLATTLTYGRARKTNDKGLLCQDQLIEGSTATPPAYACREVVIGEPAWRQTSKVRVELRHYLGGGISWNPSFTYAWAGPEVGLFEPEQGSWQFDVPLFIKIATTNEAGSTKAEEKKSESAVVVGTAFTHRQTWGLGDANERSDDLSVFLGGAFDIGRL